jgi:hypothetical protein
MFSASWTDPLPPPPQPAGSSMSLDTMGGAFLFHGALGALPNLSRVKDVRIRLWKEAVLSAAHLPAVVQRFAGCADMWWLHIDPGYAQITLAALKEQLPPGSLAALRYLRIDCHGLSAHRWSALMQRLLAAAPNICSLCLYSMECIPALATEQTLLQPLKHAAQLQTLILDMDDNVVDAPQLVAK